MELLHHFTSHTVGYDDTFTRIHNVLNNMQFVSDWPVVPNQWITIPTMSRPAIVWLSFTMFSSYAVAHCTFCFRWLDIGKFVTNLWILMFVSNSMLSLSCSLSTYALDRVSAMYIVGPGWSFTYRLCFMSFKQHGLEPL